MYRRHGRHRHSNGIIHQVYHEDEVCWHCSAGRLSNLLVQLPRGLLEEIDLPQSHIFPPTERCKSQGAFHLGSRGRDFVSNRALGSERLDALRAICNVSDRPLFRSSGQDLPAFDG